MSKAIAELYKKAGEAGPKHTAGKAIHTLAAHKMVIALMKRGYSKESAWKITMSKMGDKALEK